MLIQILTHTPVYVWAILAFLVFRGVVAMRDRDIALRKLFIIPAVMLVLSLQDVASKFGINALALAAWAAGALATMALVWHFSSARIGPGAVLGTVRVRGSWAPLAMMMAIFLTKYITAVVMAVQPQLGRHALFSAAVCVLFGVFNGYFVGRLARDVIGFQALKAATRPSGVAAIPA